MNENSEATGVLRKIISSYFAMMSHAQIAHLVTYLYNTCSSETEPFISALAEGLRLIEKDGGEFSETGQDQ